MHLKRVRDREISFTRAQMEDLSAISPVNTKFVSRIDREQSPPNKNVSLASISVENQRINASYTRYGFST